MTEQQTRQHRLTRETSPLPVVNDNRPRRAIDDRAEAVKRWIGEDDDACCRGID